MNVIIYGPNLGPNTETFHVHRTGCADTTKGIYRRIRSGGDQGGWTADVESVQAIVEDVYSDIMGENEGDLATWQAYLSEFHIFPCVDLPTEAPA